ncbi:MAG: hypothetical protein HY881_11660 [Deltaproteobacteria bacterium]|nr:hypothetical protein [Deltaproteobacteria bacterium]
MLFSKLKPATPINWLIAAAGFTWSTVGILLCRLAYGWLDTLIFRVAVLSGAAGMVGMLVAYHFVFSAIALKNIGRLSLFPEKACFFAFQAWKSYLIIVVMVALGATLRHSPIPREYLAALYLTIGGALLLSSLHYYVRLWHLIFPRKP